MKIPRATDALRRLVRLGRGMGIEPGDGQSGPANKDEPKRSFLAVGIGLGVAIGTALSVATDQYAYVGVGIAIGVALGVALDNRKPQGPESGESSAGVDQP